MNEYEQANKNRWNELATLHFKSDFYHLKAWRNGGSSLLPIETKEVGDVSGKKLLHLQCHFGMDTLSFARMGASVTGVDFSDEAIDLGNQLASDLNLDGKFICENVLELRDSPHLKGEKFDIIFTSYGVLCWLSDLSKWSKVISQYLKPGGVFYIIDSHPFTNGFDNENETTHWKPIIPYFTDKVFRYDIEYSYTGQKISQGAQASYEWFHTTSEIINNLIKAGLKIEFFNEHPVSSWRQFAFMHSKDGKTWELNEDKVDLPLSFSIKACK